MSQDYLSIARNFQVDRVNPTPGAAVPYRVQGPGAVSAGGEGTCETSIDVRRISPVEISLILQEAWGAGAKLKVEEGKLLVIGPPGVLSGELLGRIRDNKATIILRLNEIARVLSECSVPTEASSGGSGGGTAWAGAPSTS